MKAPRNWPFGEFTGDRWIPRTNGQQRGKCFHLMTSSYYVSFFSFCILYPRVQKLCTVCSLPGILEVIISRFCSYLAGFLNFDWVNDNIISVPVKRWSSLELYGWMNPTNAPRTGDIITTTQNRNGAYNLGNIRRLISQLCHMIFIFFLPSHRFKSCCLCTYNKD